VTALLVAAYIAALVIANLSLAALGPALAPINAFLLIGFDLTMRDVLHERLTRPVMVLLIVLAGGISFWVNPAAAQIAAASAIAFSVSGFADMAVYIAAWRQPRMVRVNASNVAGSAVDSVLFPALAFGTIDPGLMVALFAAKVGGGLIWSWVLNALPVWRNQT
jgi:uncharacterized PurR-regulated membrane protein YhhQ (DUF165 family)